FRSTLAWRRSSCIRALPRRCAELAPLWRLDGRITMRVIHWAMSVSILGLAGCASSTPPHDRQASSEAAIRAANEVGAPQVPQAPLHLKLAQEQLERGKAQIKNSDNDAAAYTLMRAQADAELALALARENKTRFDAQQVIEKAQTLRNERSAVGGGPNNV